VLHEGKVDYGSDGIHIRGIAAGRHKRPTYDKVKSL